MGWIVSAKKNWVLMRIHIYLYIIEKDTIYLNM